MRTITYSASALALLMLAAPAAADTVPFVDTTPGPTTFTAPETGVYDILAFGAQGGASFPVGGVGGLGAEVGGDFNLTSGEILSIVVGGAGISSEIGSGGGGGGTFVLRSTGTALLIAGGGGGGGSNVAGPGLMSGDGGNSVRGGLGGADGSGGGGGGVGSGGGGGLNSAGGGGATGGGAAGGAGGSGLDGGGGGAGGGGAGGDFLGGGGGGGGFSGGGGGLGAGGGGSLNDAFANLIGFDGVRSGNGELDIDLVPPAVPEPSTWAMLLLGFAGLGALAYRRNRSGSRPAKA
jgi:hypothetical protein